jgi:hypothetical protein
MTLTRQEIDIIWQRALSQSIKDGEQFTRYHFAEMIAAHEREECAKACEKISGMFGNSGHIGVCITNANAIRARGQA